MTRYDDSLEKRLQHSRDELRRLENLRFFASIIFTLAGVILVAAILYWARDTAINIPTFRPQP